MNMIRFAHFVCGLNLALFVCVLAWPLPAQERPQVAITVDDLPSHGDLPSTMKRSEVAKSMIATFKAKGVPMVYGFVNAKWAEEDQDKASVLRIWADAGFPLGNHTYSHIDINTATPEAFEAEIAGDESTLQALMGSKDWHWLRYPYLHEGDSLEKRQAVREYLKEHGYKIAQVTLDFGDYAWNVPYTRCTEKQDTQAIAWLKSSYLQTASESFTFDRKLSAMLFGRDIKYVLLIHIGGFDSVMLPELLDLMKKQGFDFVPLPDAEKDPAYQSDPDAPLPHGGTLLEQLIESKHMKYPPIPERPMQKLDAICR
ncbi:MAG TPA: polysaccharide deacetylase family protein [Candidatus Acidoferrum sp.]|nr:polysaccharide deacetylase family protein [Candidatus Acidoferrum sp.]